MATRNQDFFPLEYYHIYNRGNTRQEIFLDTQDYDRFTKLLYLCNSGKRINFRDDIVSKHIDAFDFDIGEPLVAIGCWVLMPNHFHLLLSPKGDTGEHVSTFIGKLLTAYSMYFNRKYKRTGTLFEGTFKSVHIDDDLQLKYIFSYQHLNPVKLINPTWKEHGITDKNKTLDFLNTYKWSSYHDYRDTLRPENKIIHKDTFPEYFKTKELFDEEIFDWLSYKDNIIP